VDATISQGRWEQEVAALQEVEAPANARWQRDKKPRWSTQPAELRVPWHRHGFCDELWAGDGCRGHLLFNPNVGM